MTPELKAYIDADGLIGQHPHVPGQPLSRWTGGNQLLETWTALVLLKNANLIQAQDIADVVYATAACDPDGDGIPDKNPPKPDGTRRMDDITHDCLLGVAMGSSILGCDFEKDIVRFGRKSGWRLSNNKKWYYTAAAKPWHRAAYLLAADEKTDDWSLAALVLSIIANAFFRMEDASGKRLTWLILEAVGSKHWSLMLAKNIWHWRIKKSYGSIRRIFIKYHGEKHPFSRLAPG